jgi:MFS family permease
MGDELNFSSTLLTNTYAIGCATLALGAPMLIPFALKFGSRSVYVVSSAAQFGVSIWAARTQTPGDWWGVNALQCWLGSLCEVLVQLTIADVYFVHQRGMMNSIYIWAMNVGGNLAVVAAGFVTTDMGWRWVWWWFVIFFGVQLVVFTLGFEETKFRQDEVIEARSGSISPVSDASPAVGGDEEKKTAKQALPVVEDAEANREDARNLSVVHIDRSIPRKTYRQKLSLTTTSPGTWLQFLRHSWQPFLILGSIPGVLYSSLVYAVLLAWNTVMTAALSTIMLDPPYEFSASQIGLMSLAPCKSHDIVHNVRIC